MERAKELLLSERLMLKDIALMLGYADAYHFGKIFKTKTGYTPGEYRQIHGL
jgi:two-component system response regulator YesN